MVKIETAVAATRRPAVDQTFAAPASRAIAAVVEAGAAILIAEPWRIARIVRGANEMTIDELVRQAARRRRAGQPADLNVAIALAQLSLALKSPRFCSSWADWRLQRETEPACRALISLDSLHKTRPGAAPREPPDPRVAAL